MTYESREESLQNGEPIELYQFTYGENAYRFTSATTEKLMSGHTWLAEPLKRDSIDFSAEKGRNNLKIETTRQFAIADLYRIMPPSDVILLTVYRFHYGDSEAVVIWSGRLLNVEFAGSRATLVCQPITTSLKRTGLRRLYQRQCPHVLYGDSCRADKNSFSLTTNLSAVNGTTLNSAAFGLYPDNYFAGGYIDFDYNGVIERRFITEHTSTQIIINIPLLGLIVGSSIIAYAGCNHTMAACKDKFNNLNNYGGMPYIPQKNPFGGNGIY